MRKLVICDIFNMLDTELISLCQRNDRKAQKELFSMYYGQMMGVCLRYAKSSEEAINMVQTGFLKVFQQIFEYEQKNNSLNNWIKDFFIKNAIAYLKGNRHEYYVTTTIKAEHTQHGTDLFHQYDEGDPNNLKSESYINALQHLPSSFRSVFNLYVIDGYSHNQIATILEISEETSRQNLEKARFSFLRNIQFQNNK